MEYHIGIRILKDNNSEKKKQENYRRIILNKMI